MATLSRTIKKLPDDSTDAGELVAIIDQLDLKYSCLMRQPDFQSTGGKPKLLTEFVAAGGIAALVHIAVTGWPADGDLAASFHRYDTLTNAGEAATESEFDPGRYITDAKGRLRGSKSGPKWRSARRKAIVCLATMCNYGGYVEAMERAGLFAPQALPAMLESSFAHVDYSLHNKGWKFMHAKDQTQMVIVRLLDLAAHALRFSSRLVQHCRKHTSMNLCKLYTDPFQQWVDKCHIDREAVRAKCRAKGWDEQRANKAARELILKQQKIEDRFGSDPHFYEVGGLDFNFVMFFNHMVQASSEPELLQLCHEGGLMSRLKGCVSRVSPQGGEGPGTAINTLTRVWTLKAVDISKDLYKKIQEEESQSLALRQKGNDAFKAGQLQEALDFYWQAVDKNPQDYALFNNISLVALKNGDAKEAYYAAEEAVRLDPTVHKSWCRLGDALKAIKRWQLAHLAYTCALELSPDDNMLKERQKEARSYLTHVWTIETVPVYGRGQDRMDTITNSIDALEWIGLTEEQQDDVMMGRDQDETESPLEN